MDNKVFVYDTTLRDGMQVSGTHFTVEDKVRLAVLLDEMGVSYIEGGSPSYNPKDEEFFRRMERISLKNAQLVAFGSTCHSGLSPENDENINYLGTSKCENICIFGKASLYHVNKVLNVSSDENLSLIYSSVKYLKDNGKNVFFDAEHFFDGFAENPEYAYSVIDTAFSAGASFVFLCDTNGGRSTDEISDTLRLVRSKGYSSIGVHFHNDIGMATASTVSAVKIGINSIQTTLTGVGERCGNADLFEIIPTLQLKMGYNCLPEGSLSKISSYYFKACEILNQKALSRHPYVGRNAFSHKGGTHIDAVLKEFDSYEHINPESVGNSRKMVLSEVSGRAAVWAKISQILPDVEISDTDVALVLNRLKNMEFEGFQYESADASFEILVRKTLGIDKKFFTLKDYKIISGGAGSSAIVDVFVENQEEVTAANGQGPVDALDRAFRKALGRFYPELNKMYLVDYKVRVLDSAKATASKVRVLIESSDGEKNWVTTGVSEDIIEASWIALVDAHEYMLYSSNVPKNSGL